MSEMRVIATCNFRTPPAEYECREACWSNGRSCRTCYRTDCYRRGWEKSLVDADNIRRVRARLEAI